MKRILFNLILAAGIVVISLIAGLHRAFGQTIRIANNNPDATPGVNVYTGTNAIRDAVAAAVSGDIIYVTPSLTSYGTFQIIDKGLTIYGVGLKPEQGGMRSTVGNIGIHGASSVIRISGLFLGTISMANLVDPSGDVSDVTIDNCRLQGIQGAINGNRLSNMVVRNCIFDSMSNGGVLNLGSDIENILITNNIMLGECCSNTSFNVTGVIIQNNFIYYSGFGRLGGQFKSNTVQNNILYGMGFGFVDGAEYNVLRNNLFFGVTEPAFPPHGTEDEDHNTYYDNIFGDPLPANFPGPTTLVWDEQWDVTPQAGSPVFAAGVGGVDIGPSGGPFPFDYEGTFLPLIQEFIVPGVIAAGEDLEITIKAKGN